MVVDSRRRAFVVTLLVLAVLAVVIGATHLVLWHDHAAVRADAVGLRDDRSTIERRIDRLIDSADDLRVGHARIAAELAATVEEVRSLADAEAHELRVLESRREEHRQLAADLDLTRAQLREASLRSERNDDLLRALHDCLDGATRAGNALSVGDSWRAVVALDSVEGACAAVRGAVGG